MMKHLRSALLVVLVLCALEASGSPSLLGSWGTTHAQVEMLAEFLADGTFHQMVQGPQGRQTFSGRYQLDGQTLYLQADGGQPAVQAVCRFADPDTAVVAYASGETLTWTRVSVQKPSPAPPKPSEPPPAAVVTPTAGGASPKTIKTLMMQRIWEPREQAFSFLLPQGWTLEGGVFNVNPLQMNGPGNTTTPKCDLTVKADARGTVMLRWVPSWNYADLSLAPTGWGTFRPGMHYQGMPVRPIVGARQFLTELIKGMRPQAADIKIVAEDPAGGRGRLRPPGRADQPEPAEAGARPDPLRGPGPGGRIPRSRRALSRGLVDHHRRRPRRGLHVVQRRHHRLPGAGLPV